VKRDTVRFIFNLEQDPTPPPPTHTHFLILEESSMSMNFLAPETSHMMALKIKDYIISSLLLAHHYLRLIVDDHSYGGLDLSG
jgi:hypothetical protein